MLEFHNTEKEVLKTEKIHEYFSEKVRHLTNETLDQITKTLLNSFELLQLAKLKKIEISDKNGVYKIDIQRENNVYTTLEKLSGAEKSLISLIFTWIVKQMVLPDKPIFLI